MRSSPQQGGARQVDLRNQSLGGQGQVADGGELVKVHVGGAGFLQGELGAPQLLILHLQLDLVHLEFVQDFLGGPCPCAGGRGKLRLRVRPHL